MSDEDILEDDYSELQDLVGNGAYEGLLNVQAQFKSVRVLRCDVSCGARERQQSGSSGDEKRKYIVQELFDTEKNYIDALRVTCNVRHF